MRYSCSDYLISFGCYEPREVADTGQILTLRIGMTDRAQATINPVERELCRDPRVLHPEYEALQP